MTTGEPSQPAPAATVVLLRPAATEAEPEVLLTRRPTTMAFAGGMHVFPGGRVDAADRNPSLAARSARSPDEAARALGDNVPPAEALALHVAVIRELAEEAGIALRDADGRFRTDLLAPIAHWVTPRFMPRRFSTWFFVADLPPGAQPVFAPDEVADHRWVTPTDALEQLAAGEIGMWVPTTSVLERIIAIGARSAADVARAITLRPAPPPRIVAETDSLVRIALGGVGALPGRAGEAVLHGRRELVLVDPGDPSDEAVDAILAAADRRSGAIRAVVLTATDPDHAAASEALAIPLEVPILVAPGAGRRLPYATRELADGERLPADSGVRVRLGPPGSGRLEVVAAPAGSGASAGK